MDSASVNEGQTSLGDGVPDDGPRICAWCGKPSVDEIELEPNRYKFVDGSDPHGPKVRILRKKAIVAKVCAYHRKSLKRRET